jgi:hypothetical protein
MTRLTQYLVLRALREAFHARIAWLLGRVKAPFVLLLPKHFGQPEFEERKNDQYPSEAADDSRALSPFQIEVRSANDQLVASLFGREGDSTLDTIRAIYSRPAGHSETLHLLNSLRSSTQSAADWIVYGP